MCPVCGRDADEPHWMGTCSVECAALFFIRPRPGMDRHDCALVSWAWRARRADVRGQAFTEAAPKCEAERALELLLPKGAAA